MFTLTQVALNDSIMVIAFAPIVDCCSHRSDHGAVGHTDHLGGALHRDPVILAQLWRRSLLRGARRRSMRP